MTKLLFQEAKMWLQIEARKRRPGELLQELLKYHDLIDLYRYLVHLDRHKSRPGASDDNPEIALK